MNNWKLPPFRADHVGSLLRPKELTTAFKAHRNGEIDDRAFATVQDQAIADVISLQEATGLKSITDGEFRRPSYWARFVDRVQGLEVRDALFTFHDDHGREVEFTAPHCASKLARPRPIAEDEYLYLAAHTSETPKITLPSPPTMHFWRLDKGIDAAAYSNSTDFFADLAGIYRAEIQALYDRGCRYVQLDEVPLAMLCDASIRDKVQTAGLDPARLIDDYIQLFNDAIGTRPDDMRLSIHVCRGNFKGHFLSEGGYEDIARRFFQEVEADGFFLEYDTPRAGDFEPLRHVPRNKRVILGMVSSKEAAMESVDSLRARIDEASRHIDGDQLGISPQCGFASTVAGNPVTVEVEKAKLSLCVEVANKVWG